MANKYLKQIAAQSTISGADLIVGTKSPTYEDARWSVDELARYTGSKLTRIVVKFSAIASTIHNTMFLDSPFLMVFSGVCLTDGNLQSFNQTGTVITNPNPLDGYKFNPSTSTIIFNSDRGLGEEFTILFLQQNL